METGSKVASDDEVVEEAESAWEEEMVKRNLLLANKVNVGLPSDTLIPNYKRLCKVWR